MRTKRLRLVNACLLTMSTAALLSSTRANAQSFIPSPAVGGANHDIVSDPPIDANVGIGLFNQYPNPIDKLTVGGNISLYLPNDGDGRMIMGRCDQGWLSIYSNTDEKDGCAVKLNGRYGQDPSHIGGVQFYANSQGVSNFTTSRAFDFSILNPFNGTVPSALVVNHSGNVCIGDGDPDVEKLTVMGNIFLKQPAAGERKIYGKTTGWMTMCSNSTIYDGSAITLYANNQPQFPGEARVTSYGSTGAVRGFRYVNNDNGTITERFGVDRNGTVHANTNVNFDLSANTTPSSINGYKPFSVFTINADGSGSQLASGGGAIELTGINASSTPGETRFTTPCSYAGNVVYNTIGGYRFQRYRSVGANGTYDQLMRIQPDGRVIIGSSTVTAPGNYLLYVQTGILTEHVKVAVATTTDWADYVFDKQYNLRPLNEVENYIAENKHLPDVPSAGDVVKEGVDLGQMNAKLLQKIEELTLYSIQQQKALNEQSEAITLQQKQIEELKTSIAK